MVNCIGNQQPLTAALAGFTAKFAAQKCITIIQHLQCKDIPICTEQMRFLHRLCTALDAFSVRYGIVDGHAAALHGVVRGTVDVDIALAWNLKSLQSAAKALNDIGLVSRLPITADDVYKFRDEYIRNRNLIVWNFYNPQNLTEQVDIIINYDLTGKKVQNITTTDGTIRVLRLGNLIAMKRASARPQDLEDVRALEKPL